MFYRTIFCVLLLTATVHAQETIPLYFDFVQLDSHQSGRKWSGKFAPIESVYDFPSEKFTGGISLATPLIRGIQANLWTETMHTSERLEFMIFPRLSALAE